MAWACLSVIVPGARMQAVVSYGVPEGFSEIELDNTASYVATYDGKTLPGLVNYSQKRAALGFDAELYAANGISVEEINAIRNVVSRIDYKQCVNGCDMQVAGHYVTVDKVRRTLDIRSSRSDYLAPSTSVGLVSSHAIDLRGSSDGYRSANVYGNTGWVCQGAALATQAGMAVAAARRAAAPATRGCRRITCKRTSPAPMCGRASRTASTTRPARSAPC